MVERSISASDIQRDLKKVRRELDALRVKLDAARMLNESFGEITYLDTSPQARAAKRTVETAPQDIERLEHRERDLVARLEAREAADHQVQREEHAYWFRRFMVSLQIGNGAAFLASVAGLLQAEAPALPIIAALVWAPAIMFGIGVVTAGILPLTMAVRPLVPSNGHMREFLVEYASFMLTAISTASFAAGVVIVLFEIGQMRQPALAAAKPLATAASAPPTQKSPAAKPSPAVPAPAPATPPPSHSPE